MPRPSRRTPPGCTDREIGLAELVKSLGYCPWCQSHAPGLILSWASRRTLCCSLVAHRKLEVHVIQVVASLCKHCSVATFQRERALESMTRSTYDSWSSAPA